MSVKRYCLDSSVNGHDVLGFLPEHVTGEWVLYEDYYKLARRYMHLKKVIGQLNEGLNSLAEVNQTELRYMDGRY